MALTASMPTTMKTPSPQVTLPAVIPAPLAGMDARVPLAVDNADTCIWAINMVPEEYAMRVRRGYREWQNALGAEIRSIIPYTGTQASGSYDRLFVATEDGIFECTTYGVAPVQKIAFSTQSDSAGYGTFIAHVDESGDDLMLYADEENGLFHYDPVTNVWTVAAGITSAPGSIGSISIGNIVFVCTHKLRIWLIEKNANKAWYLPIRSATGPATEFYFGSKFKFGGDLVGLFNWTVDGGYGRDDHLVAISRGGDVIPWTGEDPADVNTWTTTGSFYVGPVPKGHRVASEYGGEMFILSKFGVTSISSLMSGAVLSDPYANVIGNKIARLLRDDLDVYGGERGWSIKLVQNIGSLLITMPVRSDGRYRQYVYNISTQGWGLWRDVPIVSANIWDGDLFFGDTDGAVHRMDQHRDGMTIAGSLGDAIDWFVLTSYSHLGAPAVFKQAEFVRTNFVAESEPLFNTIVFYDYQKNEPQPLSGGPENTGSDVWDTGLWGTALWSFTQETPFNTILGGSGIGRSIAIALIGKSTTQTDLVSFDLLWSSGGLL